MIDTDKYEKLIESIVICEEEWIKGQDSLVEDSRRLKACATRLLAEVERLREELALYEKYVICHPDGTHCCDECLERNGFEVMKNEHR